MSFAFDRGERSSENQGESGVWQISYEFLYCLNNVIVSLRVFIYFWEIEISSAHIKLLNRGRYYMKIIC